MFDLPTVPQADPTLPGNLELGALSISLNVADLDASREFYEKLGFVVTGGDPAHGYQILKNGEATIGIFHGMFEGQILTFNPGLTGKMERLEEYTDIREVQTQLKESGIELATEVESDSTEGAASITLVDPDGNAILIDQFF
jgi:catechol 2,3-dioxygenase-like lactoylglutathione lyase family enzyme